MQLICRYENKNGIEKCEFLVNDYFSLAHETRCQYILRRCSIKTYRSYFDNGKTLVKLFLSTREFEIKKIVIKLTNENRLVGEDFCLH